MTKRRPTPAERAEAKRALAEILAAEDWPDDAWPVAIHMTPWSYYRGAVEYFTASVSAEQISDVLKGASMITFQSDERPILNATRVTERVHAALAAAWGTGIRRIEIRLHQVSAHERIAAEIAASRWDNPARGVA